MTESVVTHPNETVVETESRLAGAYRSSWGNAWWSMITHNGTRVYLGTFPSAEAAHLAYEAAKKRITPDKED